VRGVSNHEATMLMRLRLLAARRARVFAMTCPSSIRGRRECRMRAAPAVSCAMERVDARMSIQAQRRHPASPA
jgi:hypothetical protein